MIDFKLFGGFGDGRTDGQTNEQTDIGDCRVAFKTENPALYQEDFPSQVFESSTKFQKHYTDEGIQFVTL